MNLGVVIDGCVIGVSREDIESARKIPHCLYRHFNDNGDLLYIGISSYTTSRNEQHRKKSPWFLEVSVIKVQHFDDYYQASEAEKKAIKEESPRYNKKHSVLK